MALVRLSTSNLTKICFKWDFSVSGAIPRSRAICLLAHAFAGSPQRMGHIESKSQRLVVLRIEGKPTDAISGLLKPFRPTDRKRHLSDARTTLYDYQSLCLCVGD